MSLETRLLAEGIIAALFDPEKRRLGATLVDLNKRNMRLQDTQTIGFLYRGLYYLPKVDGMRGGIGNKSVLHADLFNDMEEFLADEQAVTRDKTILFMLVVKALEPCLTLQDVRDTLPDFLVEIADDIRKENLMGITRFNPIGFTLEGHRLHKKFLDAIPTLEFYNGTRLLY